MTKVYIVRHGETEGNYYGRVSGFYDTHLTGRGLKQISQLTERFKDIHIDAVYASNRDRAIKTAAAAVKGKGLEVNINPRLGECSLGVWDNTCWGELEYYEPDLLNKYRTDFMSWYSKYAESFEDLRARMIGVVKELAKKHDGQTIMLVSHGHAIRALLCEVDGVPNEKVSTRGYGGNTAVSLLNVDGDNVTAEYQSDMSHIKGKVDSDGKPFLREVSPAAGKALFSVYSEPIDLDKYEDFYLSCRKKQYVELLGNSDGFDGQKYLETARKRIRKSPEGVLIVKHMEELVGIVELDTRRDAESGFGWIDFYYIDEKYRDTTAVMQPFGHIIGYYRIINRTELRMMIPNATKEQISFFENYDMFVVSRDGNDVIMGYDLYM